MRCLLWMRADLRTTDNPALSAACREQRRGVVTVFVIAADQWREHDWGLPRVSLVLRTLAEFAATAARLNIPLRILHVGRFADTPAALLRLADDLQCDALYFNREYELNELRRDAAVAAAFEASGRTVHAFCDQCVFEPGSIRTGSGEFYSVFTPFQRRFRALLDSEQPVRALPEPPPVPEPICASDPVPTSAPGFDGSFRADLWPAGEQAARTRLNAFVRQRMQRYDADRDFPGLPGTSELSPYLAVGAVSIRQCLSAAIDANDGRVADGDAGAVKWISELVWREFYRHVMFGFQRVCMRRAFRAETESLPWRADEERFAAWREGRTGVPIVDAGMRQLRQTGWMHNRVRMIVAMYLTKDLFLDWRWGERHFAHSLVDLDLASNNGGWQWSASTGVDAAPYFRIFNPYSQSRRFDPSGAFIRRFVPELAALDDHAIHEPFPAGCLPPVRIDYPRPVEDHAEARRRVLDAFADLGGGLPVAKQRRRRRRS